MNINYLIDDYDDPSLETYLKFKAQALAGIHLEFDLDKYPKSLMDFLDYVVKTYSQEPVPDPMFLLYNRKRIVSERMVRSLSEIDIENDTFDVSTLALLNVSMWSIQKSHVNGKVSAFLKFSDNMGDLEKRFYLKPESTQSYVQEILKPMSIQRYLANYQSSAWLDDRLSLWGDERFAGLKFNDFGFKDVRVIEEFCFLLTVMDISAAQVMEKTLEFAKNLKPQRSFLEVLQEKFNFQII